MASYEIVYNPYEDIDWSTTLQLKTELHCHTVQSDGIDSLANALDLYTAANYDAMAISNHNSLTWPWENWGIDSKTSGITDIPNVEITNPLWHMTACGGLKLLDGDNFKSLQAAIDAVLASGGIPVICHPSEWKYPLTWLDSYFGFQGLEVYNGFVGLNHYDFTLWDHLLTDTNRRGKNHIWGFAVGDAHYSHQVNKGWITVYSRSTNTNSIMENIRNGSFTSNINSKAKVQSIRYATNTVSVDSDANVVWLADKQQIVGRSGTIHLDALPEGLTYIRPELIETQGFVVGQPFFIKEI